MCTLASQGEAGRNWSISHCSEPSKAHKRFLSAFHAHFRSLSFPDRGRSHAPWGRCFTSWPFIKNCVCTDVGSAVEHGSATPPANFRVKSLFYVHLSISRSSRLPPTSSVSWARRLFDHECRKKYGFYGVSSKLVSSGKMMKRLGERS